MAGSYDGEWLAAAVTGYGLTKVAVLPTSASGTVWVRALALVEQQPVELRVGLSVDFPTELPVVRLHPWDALGVLPHITAGKGTVCYQDSEGLLLDQSQPEALVSWALAHALAELAKGIRGENKADFTEEFEASWLALPSKTVLHNVADVPQRASELNVIWRTNTEAYTAADANQVLSFLQFDRLGKYTLQQATFLPLPAGSYIEPPRPDQPFWTAAELRQWLAPGLELLSAKERRKLLEGRHSQHGIIVVSLPRPSQGVALFALRYQSPIGEHPLLPGIEAKLWPLQLLRLERSYLVPRGGGQNTLAGKRILLVGCGAVGGRLAHDLVQSGILDITLVDADLHAPDNTFRHVLGYPRKGFVAKVTALHDELRVKYPYVQVKAVKSTIQSAYQAGKIIWNDYDLVIAATGNPTIELWLNAQLHQPGVRAAALFTWLEAYGIGGHALLTQANQPGCLRCLYTDPDVYQLLNRAAFAQAGQKFSMSLAGCSARHTPYGALDASRTAELAARLALRSLTGSEHGAPLLSWKGDAADFLAAGFHLAPRYQASEEQLFRNRYLYVAPTCPVCGSTVTAHD